MEIEKSIKVWYPALIEELEAIYKEGRFIFQFDLIRFKWLVGKTIEDRVKDFERADIYGMKINQKIAKSLRAKKIPCTERDIGYCRRFYKKFPQKDWELVVPNLPEGKNLTWTKIRQKYLPNEEKKEHKHQWDISQHWFCIICGIKRFSDPYKKKYEKL